MNPSSTFLNHRHITYPFMTFQISSIINTCSNPQHHASIMTHDVLHTSMHPTTTSRRLLISLFNFHFSMYPSSMTFFIHCYVTYSSMTFQTSSIIVNIICFNPQHHTSIPYYNIVKVIIYLSTFILCNPSSSYVVMSHIHP
jgi:hypothetical protein